MKRLTKTLTMKWQKHKLIKKEIRESEHYIEIQDQGKLKVCSSYVLTRASQVTPVVQICLPMQETWETWVGLTPGSGRSPGGGNSNPFKYSCLENPRDRDPGGLQWVHRVAKGWTRLKQPSIVLLSVSKTDSEYDCEPPNSQRIKSQKDVDLHINEVSKN